MPAVDFLLEGVALSEQLAITRTQFFDDRCQSAPEGLGTYASAGADPLFE